MHGGARDFYARVEMPDVSIPPAAFGAWVANLDPYSVWVQETKRGVNVDVETHKAFDWQPTGAVGRH